MNNGFFSWFGFIVTLLFYLGLFVTSVLVYVWLAIQGWRLLF